MIEKTNTNSELSWHVLSLYVSCEVKS